MRPASPPVLTRVMACGVFWILQPAGRGERDAQVFVIEVAPAHDALLARVAEAHAFDGLLVALALVVAELALVFGGDGGDVGQALVVAGVGGQPVVVGRGGLARGARLVGRIALLALEHGDHVDHVLRVVADLWPGRPRPARRTGIPARGCTRPRSPRPPPGRSGPPAWAAPLTPMPSATTPSTVPSTAARPAFCCLVARWGAVPRGDVADLVADHAGQVGLAVEVGHDAARDVHIAAGQRKGVDLGAVEHREGPRQVGPLRLARQAQADVGHVGPAAAHHRARCIA